MPLLLRACLNLCDDQRPVEPFLVWGGRKDGWHNKTAVAKSDRQKLIIKLKNNFTTPPRCYLLPTIRSFQFCFIIQILSDILVWKRDYFLYGALTSESSSVTKTTIRVFVQEMNQHKTDNCDRRKILCFGRGHSSFMGCIAWSQLMTKFKTNTNFLLSGISCRLFTYEFGIQGNWIGHVESEHTGSRPDIYNKIWQ